MRAKPQYEADLHCHTTASDGQLSPGALIRLAAEKGLQAIAITDHDTISGWAEAEEAAKQVHIVLLKGIEINTDWEGKEVHILGYGMDNQDSALKLRLADLQEKRLARIKKIIEKLDAVGFHISFAEVMQLVKGQSAGRPHVAQIMQKKGFVASVKEAFDKYLRIGAPAYVPRYKLTPIQAIQIIQDAGGVPVIAHPGAQCLEKEIGDWVNAGLKGIEVIHPDHSFEDNIRYRIIAEQFCLVATGGSDYHGPGIKQGINLGDWGVSIEVVEKIIEMTKLHQEDGHK